MSRISVLGQQRMDLWEAWSASGLLSLSSPRWATLKTSGYPDASSVPELLRQIAVEGLAGPAWRYLYEGPLALGEIQEVTYATLPYLVKLGQLHRDEDIFPFLFSLACIVNNFDTVHVGPPRPRIPVELRHSFYQSITEAEQLALATFLKCSHWQEQNSSDAAIACLALAQHPVGILIQQTPEPPSLSNEFIYFYCCECELEDWIVHTGTGIRLLGDAELDQLSQLPPDPLQPPLTCPPLPELAGHERFQPQWQELANRLQSVWLDLNPSRSEAWKKALQVGTAIAQAGVPQNSPVAATLCLLVAMVALTGQLDWAARLLHLASPFRCPECGTVQPIVGIGATYSEADD